LKLTDIVEMDGVAVNGDRELGSLSLLASMFLPENLANNVSTWAVGTVLGSRETL